MPLKSNFKDALFSKINNPLFSDNNLKPD